MDLYLLKVNHKYDAKYEDIGIFSSLEKMKEGEKQYIKVMFPVPEEEFQFTYKIMKLNELY